MEKNQIHSLLQQNIRCTLEIKNNTQGCATRLTLKIQVHFCSSASPATVLILEAGYTVNSAHLKYHVKLAFLEMQIMW